MKRFYFGLALLLALLAAGIGTTLGILRGHEPVVTELALGSKAALLEDWSQAGQRIERAQSRWEQYWKFSASLADHGPMEEIDGLFAQLEVYLDVRDPVLVAAACAELSRQVEAISDAHELNWWSLL